VDMIVQNISADSLKTDVTFTVKRDDLKKTKEIFDKLKNQLEFEKLLTDDKVSKVSIVGAGMITHPGVAYKMFDAYLQKKSIFKSYQLLKSKFLFW
jgi:Aspartokinases